MILGAVRSNDCHEVTPTTASTVVVPTVGAAVPVAEAVPEEEELCEKRDILRMKHCYKKMRWTNGGFQTPM
jgi:hypothetical protein